MTNQNNNEEWRTELEKVLPKLSERSWKKIASQLSQAEQRGYERGCDEDNSDEILWKRMKEWNKEWQDENPKERSLTWQDALKLIEWKIEKAEHRGRGSIAEELEILKTMCEETKRERDCAEKKLKEVLEWADKKYQYTEKYKEISPYFDGYNSSKDELRQILTGENN